MRRKHWGINKNFKSALSLVVTTEHKTRFRGSLDLDCNDLHVLGSAQNHKVHMGYLLCTE